MLEPMNGSASAPDPNITNARCAVHPEVAASGVCTRCGDYHCSACQKVISGRSLCASCRALPGIDYLEDTRVRFWGKRDGYVWYIGLFGGVLGGFGQLVTQARSPAGLEPWLLTMTMIWIACALAYLALWRPARVALIAVSALAGLNNIIRALPGGAALRALTPAQRAAMDAMGYTNNLLVLAVVGALFSILIALAAYNSPRNKLAFQIEIDERALQRVYDTFISNTLAMRAAWYSVFLGFVPFAGLVTLGMGVVALRRADASAWPPRGGRTPALIAIVVSLLWSLSWVVVISLLRR
jgi:hypothetical protein